VLAQVERIELAESAKLFAQCPGPAPPANAKAIAAA